MASSSEGYSWLSSTSGAAKKESNDQAVYPLSEQYGLGGPREEIHRPWMMEALRKVLRQGRSGEHLEEWLRGQMQGLFQDLLEQEDTEFQGRTRSVRRLGI